MRYAPDHLDYTPQSDPDYLIYLVADMLGGLMPATHRRPGEATWSWGHSDLQRAYITIIHLPPTFRNSGRRSADEARAELRGMIAIVAQYHPIPEDMTLALDTGGPDDG